MRKGHEQNQQKQKEDHLSPGPLSLGAVSCVVGVHLAFLTTGSQAVGGVHLQKGDLDQS